MFKTILQIFPLQNQHRKCLKSADSAWFKSIRDHNLTRLLHLYCCAVKCLVCLCRQYLEFFFPCHTYWKSCSCRCVQTVPWFPPQHWGDVKPYQDLFNNSALINSLSPPCHSSSLKGRQRIRRERKRG